MVLLLTFGFFAGVLSQVHACQICLPIPTTSAADHLLEAEVVVLAREDPQNPFSLRTVEVLKGDPATATIDLFLDSQSRRTLALFPRRKIICSYRSTGPDAGWQRIGTADSAFGPLVREILDRSASWKEAPKERAAFFAKSLGHKNSQISTLAHLEVARAPYDQIKGFAVIVRPENLRAFLKNFRLFEWHALYILLLAQSGEEQDHKLIIERVRSAERFGTVLQLAAWATAWIEIDEETALDFFHERYLKNPERKPDEVQAVHAALSVHGSNGHTHLRDRIVDGYRMILANHPTMASKIVTDLMAWKRWDLAETVAGIVEVPPSKLDRAALLQLRSYTRLAGEAGSGDIRDRDGSEGRGASFVVAVIVAALVLVPVGLSVISRLRPAKAVGS